MSAIGDLFFRLFADGSTLTPSVVKAAEEAGDAGSKTLGQKLSAGLKTNGVKAFGVAAAGAFAIATKGALQLEQVQANFQAETGASAEEASRAADVINKAAGDNRLSLEEVSDAAIKVHNDLGAVGDEADVLTAKFAEYGRVTKQQAGAAVSEFDDILDAWGLTAADATDVMDKLIASHQKYGGSITDNQKQLAAFAPQLQALGATVDDGIGLLNLFAASGLDASKATQALNTAVKNLKPGQTLDDLIRQISSIEDPTERAKAAIKVFGSRGGVGLANALKPGINSLKDFEISTADAAGATDKAADVIDSTLSGRIAKAVSQAQAALRGFGKDLGPAITAGASVASLLAGSGLFNGLGSKIGGLIAAGIGGSKAYAIAIAGAIDLLPGVGAVKGAIAATGAKIGTALGISSGTAFAAAFAAAAAAAVAAVALVALDQQKKIDEQGDALLQQAKDFSKIANDADLANSIKGVREQLDQIPGNAYDAKNKVIAILNTLIAEQNRRAETAGEAIPTAVAEGIQKTRIILKPTYEALTGDESLAMERMQDVAKAAGAEIPKSVAEGVLARQAKVPDAMSTLVDLMKHALGRASIIARDIGILTSKRLAKGLTDRRGAVRKEAEYVRAEAEKELARLILAGGKVGEKAMKELKKGLQSKNPEVRAAAQRVKDIVDGRLQATVTPAGAAGAAAGQAYASNLKTAVSSALAFTVTATGSKKPKPGKDGRAAGGSVTGGVGYQVNEHTPRSEWFVPSTSGYVLTHADAMKALSGGGNGPLIGTLVVNPGNDVSPAAAKRFGTAVMDEVSKGLREQRARGIGRR